jgi:subtilisin-like proprotein convertase family protein
VNLVGTSPSNTHTTAFTLTVNGPSGCRQTTNADVPTRDWNEVAAEITIWGCAGNAAATSSVSLDIVHTYIGDLSVVLRSPTGGWYTLHAGAGASADNIAQTYTVDLSGEVANGTWRLEVRDWNAPDTGYISSWSLNLGGVSPPSCGRTNDADVPVPDLSTGNGTIAVSGCAGNASGAATVAVDIRHPYIGDLNVTLIAPDGSAYLLRDRTGSNSDNISRTFTVNLSSEARAGTWTLRVRDLGPADVGHLNSWTLTI